MTILYEDNHLIIVNKSCSEIVQADKTGDPSLEEDIKQWLKRTYNKAGNVFLGVTHRLDRPVTGVVIFAKTSKALARLNEMFRKGEIHKTYFALVKNSPPATEGRLEHFLWRNEKQNKSYICEQEKPGSKKAILDYKLLGRSDRYALLEIDLKPAGIIRFVASWPVWVVPSKGILNMATRAPIPIKAFRCMLQKCILCIR
jgi:23S rRNA pseudouridine1911/1915/1917 synthase